MYYNMNSTKSSNGRVDIINKTQAPDLSNLFAMYDKIPANQCATFREPTLGQWDETPLSKAYFSKENIQIIQNGIRAGVYNKSNSQYVIGAQDCDALKIIMRSVFLQHSANQPIDIAGQIEQLNQMVLDYCIHHVYSEAQGYMKYLYDVSTLVVPMANPVVETQKDKNNYLMPKWF
jgi:type 1 glutamine amidotransferase